MEEALTQQQRLKRARIMKVKGKIIARKRKIAMRRKASSEKLKKRAQKQARNVIAKRLLRDRDKSDLSFGTRQSLEKQLDRKKAVIKRIAKKLLPSVKKKESERISKRRGGD